MKKKITYSITEKEYQAYISGINIFFGAIIGVVMAEYDIASTWDYVTTLLLVGCLVTWLLYVSATKHRLANVLGIACFLVLIWYRAYPGSPISVNDPAWLQLRLIPTFSVWLVFIVLAEFLPREKPEN